MGSSSKQNILYSHLAEWWPLLSSPEEYTEEASLFKEALVSHCKYGPRTIVELGAGGGNNASHLKKHFEMTLVDLSSEMLKVSSGLNPECTHIQGDMRDVRLGLVFDAVFIHDAIAYMASIEQLRQAMATAFIHCRAGGAALIAPDCTTENFQPSTEHGGHDDGNRGLRYLEWTMDLDPNDNMYTAYMVYLLKDGDIIRDSGLDEHQCGLFSKTEWLTTMSEVGFRATTIPYDHSVFEKGTHHMFLGIKPE